VNAPVLASELGVGIEEQRSTDHKGFAELIEVEVFGKNDVVRRVAGTIMGKQEPRVLTHQYPQKCFKLLNVLRGCTMCEH